MASGSASSKVTWELAPPKPMELTEARRGEVSASQACPWMMGRSIFNGRLKTGLGLAQLTVGGAGFCAGAP